MIFSYKERKTKPDQKLLNKYSTTMEDGTVRINITGLREELRKRAWEDSNF